MEEKELKNRIKELEGELNAFKEELYKITEAREIEELKKIYELFKEDTFIKVKRFDGGVSIYHITDKQELKLNTAFHRYYFTAHYDSLMSFDRKSKEISTFTYSEKRYLEYESSPNLKKDNFSVIQPNEIGQLINELTQSILQRKKVEKHE